MKQHSLPILLFAGSSHPLKSNSGRTVEERGYDENFIRNLVSDSPEILPVKEINPRVSQLVR